MNTSRCNLIVVMSLLGMLFSGCASFNSSYLPEPQSTPPKDSLRQIKMVYVLEGLKPQDNGEMCYKFHGCLWHGKNSFGEVLSQNFSKLGVKSRFLGASRNPDFNTGRIENLGADEYFVDAKVRYISDSAGSWFMKSLAGGFSLTMIPIWQTITTDVDVSLTDRNKEVVWKNRYTDSYTGLVWFFMLPMIPTASSTPDDITDRIARTAISDMSRSGVFSR